MSLHCHNSLVSCLLRPLASIEEHSPDAHREERIVMTMQCAQLNCITASGESTAAHADVYDALDMLSRVFMVDSMFHGLCGYDLIESIA